MGAKEDFVKENDISSDIVGEVTATILDQYHDFLHREDYVVIKKQIVEEIFNEAVDNIWYEIENCDGG